MNHPRICGEYHKNEDDPVCLLESPSHPQGTLNFSVSLTYINSISIMYFIKNTPISISMNPTINIFSPQFLPAKASLSPAVAGQCLTSA